MSATPRFSTADIARGAQRAEQPQPEPVVDRVNSVAQSEPDAATIRVNEGPHVLEAREAADAQKLADDRRAAAETAAADRQVREDRQLPEDSVAPLFASDAALGFQRRWDAIQAGFVDDPRHAVEEADALVAETMQRLAETFAQERERIEQQLDVDAKTETSTEELRIALRHYRSFFKRLLSV